VTLWVFAWRGKVVVVVSACQLRPRSPTCALCLSRGKMSRRSASSAGAASTPSAAATRGRKRQHEEELDTLRLDLQAERNMRRGAQRAAEEQAILIRSLRLELEGQRMQILDAERRADSRPSAPPVRRVVSSATARTPPSSSRVVSSATARTPPSSSRVVNLATARTPPSSGRVVHDNRQYQLPACPICCEDVDDATAEILACGHAIHSECLGQLRRHRMGHRCPICRAPVAP
jgi:hypothetical protein